MGKVNALVHAFNNGEVSVGTLARVDQEKARLWAETQENLLHFTTGKAIMRPGTTYLGDAATHANRVREIPFVKSLAATAGLELSSALLRVWVGDALVTRPPVTSTITNGDFSSATGWTLTASAGATADINTTVSGSLWMACPHRGATASCAQSVSTSSANTQHALRIAVTRGPVVFRCGSTSGGDEYIKETTLGTGTHSLAFTPTASPFHIKFMTRREAGIIVDSIQVEAAGVMTITAPWTEAELRKIQFDQSGDIVFLAHGTWQPRKIERRGDNSWSLVKYDFIDGPFTIGRTAEVKMSVNNTHGNTTILSDAAFFRSEHLEALFRLTHPNFNAEWGLAGEEEYTDVLRVSGVGVDMKFDVTRASTWIGTLVLYRSIDSETGGFVASTHSYTTTGTETVQPSTVTLNNVIQWYKVGFGSTAAPSTAGGEPGG